MLTDYEKVVKSSPLAVLKSPMVLLKSALTPLAVLELPLSVAKERLESDGGVKAPVVLF